MNIVRLHQLIDQWAADERAASEAKPVQTTSAETTFTNPPVASDEPKKPFFNDKNQRAVRTKTSGDRVYILDETAKTRQWVTNPQVLEGLGFTLNNVDEIDEAVFLKYSMGAALYKLPDAPTA